MHNKEINLSRNILQWEEKIIDIFPINIPHQSIWNEDLDILNILFALSFNKINKIYYPDGQIFTLFGVDLSKEYKCIELITEKSIDIIKPIRLSFHFINRNYEWSYFRLETAELRLIGKNNKNPYKEEMVDLDNGKYVELTNFFNNSYKDKDKIKQELINKEKIVNRYYKKSSFLIFAREARFEEIYNKLFNTYSETELESIIEKLELKQV